MDLKCRVGLRWVFLAIMFVADGMVWADKGRFVVVDTLPGATIAHAAAGLDDGTVLVTGGYGKMLNMIPLASSLGRIFDGVSLKWRITAGRLNLGRINHAAVKLSDGSVLIAGGRGQDGKPMHSIERYDPASQKFYLVGDMVKSRSGPVLTVIDDQRVLVTGGPFDAEIIEVPGAVDEKHPVRVLESKLRYRHDEHVCVRTLGGEIVIVGGRTSGIEHFDGASETFYASKARLPRVLDDFVALLLYDGRILLAGGQDIYTMQSVNTIFIYDAVKQELTAGPTFVATAEGVAQPGAADMKAVDLYEGDAEKWGRYIFLAGGEYDPGKGGKGGDVILDSAFIYNAVDNTIVSVGPMNYQHDEFAAASLPVDVNGDRRALIVGGYGPHDKVEAFCEIFSVRIPWD